jgi:hypothetical protein
MRTAIILALLSADLWEVAPKEHSMGPPYSARRASHRSPYCFNNAEFMDCYGRLSVESDDAGQQYTVCRQLSLCFNGARLKIEYRDAGCSSDVHGGWWCSEAPWYVCDARDGGR